MFYYSDMFAGAFLGCFIGSLVVPTVKEIVCRVKKHKERSAV